MCIINFQLDIIDSNRFVLWLKEIRFDSLDHVHGLLASVLFELYKPYLPTPPLGQDMTQGHFLSGF